jgi:hypothetical protein
VKRLAAKPNAKPTWTEKVIGETADAELLKTDLAARGKALGFTIRYDDAATMNAAGAGTARGYVKPGSKIIHVRAELDPKLQATVIAHEMGHLLDQVFATEESKTRWSTLSDKDSYAHNEIIAESFSNLVSKLYNIDSDSHAIGYTVSRPDDKDDPGGGTASGAT